MENSTTSKENTNTKYYTKFITEPKLDGINLTLCQIPHAEKHFPTDPLGDIILKFKSKSYKIQKYILRFSSILSRYFVETQKSNTYDLNLKYSESEEAVELVMRLLFGFKEVFIEKLICPDVLSILEELGNAQTNYFSYSLF